MGGHSAWRKRVAAGQPAKGRGGAIARHHPHLGRKGEDLKLNRKGNIAGGNPKKMKGRRNTSREDDGESVTQSAEGRLWTRLKAVAKVTASVTLAISVIYGMRTSWLSILDRVIGHLGKYSLLSGKGGV